MKQKRSVISWAAAGLAAATALTMSTVVHANNNGVYWSVGVSSPGVHVGVQNTPPSRVYHVPQVVYTQPQVIYQPQVVYQQPQVVYVRPAPVYVQPQPIYYVPAAPVYHVPPRVGHGGWHHPRHGWQQHGQGAHSGHGGQPGQGVHPGWQSTPQVHGAAGNLHGRIAGVLHGSDQGRNYR